MTVIATDGKTIASDTLSLFSDERAVLRAKKIFVRETESGPVIFGMSGSSGMYQSVMDWFIAGHDPKEAPPLFQSNGWGMIVITRDKMFYVTSECPYPAEVLPPMSTGAGERVATVAMRCGKTPAEGVALAIEMLTCCGGDIDVIDIDEVFGRSSKPDPVNPRDWQTWPRLPTGPAQAVLLAGAELYNGKG